MSVWGAVLGGIIIMNYKEKKEDRFPPQIRFKLDLKLELSYFSIVTPSKKDLNKV